MADMHTKLLHVSVNCNPSPKALAWDTTHARSTLFFFGAHSSVAVCDSSRAKIVAVIRDTAGRINCVGCAPRHLDGPGDESAECVLVTGTITGVVTVWSFDRETLKYRKLASFTEHTDAVTSVAALRLDDNRVLVGSCSCDGNVNFHVSEGAELGEWETVQTLGFSPRPMESIAFSPMRHKKQTTSVLVALGGLDSKVHLYASSAASLQFRPLVKLEGHEDWIRDVSFCTTTTSDKSSSSGEEKGEEKTASGDGDILLASASQDKKIRVWRISESAAVPDENNSSFHALSSFGRYRHLVSLENTDAPDAKTMAVVSFEALLSGHEDWVYSVCWHPRVRSESGSWHQPLALLSTSMDKSMLIWRPEESHEGVWTNQVRVGETNVRAQGFYGGAFGPEGRTMIAHSFSGALLMWTLGESNNVWRPAHTVSGHYQAVMDLSWDSSETYLLSASSDQTVRVLAPHKRDDATDEVTWHEIARPQIHGYDMNSLCIIPSKPHMYASGAAEKVIRAFEAPQPFINDLTSISGSCLSSSSVEASGSSSQNGGKEDRVSYRVTVPELGLSNKILDEEELKTESEKAMGGVGNADGGESKSAESGATRSASNPPIEHTLSHSTLWPEVQKLYGHGYDLISLSSTHSRERTLIASTCSAKSDKHAVVRLWDTSYDGPTWREVPDALPHAHTLTVAQTEFSRDDRYLLAVGRDRSFAVFQRDPDSSEWPPKYSLMQHKKKVHARIIWSCSWSSDGAYFATGSRDKKVKIWALVESQWSCVAQLVLKSAVTAVAFSPQKSSSVNGKDYSYMIGVGTEDGRIELFAKPKANEDVWESVHSVEESKCHAAAVRRLRWRRAPKSGSSSSSSSGGEGALQLASCSLDHSVRVFELH